MSEKRQPLAETPVTNPLDLREHLLTRIYEKAAHLAQKTTTKTDQGPDWDHRIDDILTSRLWGFPVMISLLGIVFWLTIVGANYPSQLLATVFFTVEGYLSLFLESLRTPEWLHGFFVLGVYRGLAWVVSVMLPPMAIFFPLFTLLEDVGYLPRVAFNLDRLFRSVGTHGKQALTMAMGFGCNAAGVISTRIIESPRERLIAILTNTFVPCNGRFPTLIAMASLFLAARGTVLAVGTVVGMVLTGFAVTLGVSWLLSHTLLGGLPSRFVLELPPYRKPQPGRVIMRSLVDRTAKVLYRAVVVAAPAGGLVWLLANIHIGDASLLAHMATALNGPGKALGMDGMILLAFFLGLPANEIVMPIMLMGYLAAGAMIEVSGLAALKVILIDQNGWTWLTALNVMLFSLLHFPCATTLITIHKETKELKWTALAALLPLAVASAVTFTLTFLARLVGWA
ncbi:MAG: nucleoside recognition domain-containing protein [Limnochordia bacterium]|jgi:ferrous iron transport protein B